MADSVEITRLRIALGRQLAAFRRAAGYTQHQLAPLTNYVRGTVGNVEVGRQNVPRSFWERCDQILQCEGVLLSSYEELATAVRQRHRGAAQGRCNGDATGLLTELLREQPDEAQPPTVPIEQFNNSGIVASADRLLSLFLNTDAEMGGDDLYKPMVRHVERLTRAANNNQTLTSISRLGQLSQLVGWLALDSNRHTAARHYFTTAIYAAHEAEDSALTASSLAYLSLQATYKGNPRQALALATTAVETGWSSSTPLVRSMLATRVARAHAKLNDRAGSLRALDKAHNEYANQHGEDEPIWISYVDSIEITAQAGACYLDLKMPVEAEASLSRAVTLLKSQKPSRIRDHVHYLSRISRSHLLAGNVEQACQVGIETLQLALTVGSARVLEQINELSNALPQEQTKVARDFRDHFASLMPPE